MISDISLKEKMIIVAEFQPELAKEISQNLSDKGYRNIRIAENGRKIFEIVEPYRNRQEQLGVIILNENLPHCQVTEICRQFACATNFTLVPILILSQRKTVPEDYISDHRCTSHCLIKTLQYPINFPELLLITDFHLRIKRERELRLCQEERLINEQAERKIIDSKLKYLIAHDELTGLYNRSNFERKLQVALTQTKDVDYVSSLLFIDIDRFSMINELEGFEIGDQLLVEFVTWIRTHLTQNLLFARIGSDEFCLFLEGYNEEQAIIFSEKIMSTVEEFRFFTGEVYYGISVSIGISSSITKEKIYHPSELVLRARQACHTAKENGRNMLWVYNDNDSVLRERRRDIYWIPLVKQALLNEQLFLVYQPVVNLKTGEISHYEALIRMRSDDNLIIPPNQFIPAAERMGLIHAIDIWVVETAIDFLAQLPPTSPSVSLAVNLSGTAFQDTALLPAIREKLQTTGVQANRLTFEITETAAVENFEKTREMINKIRKLGCKFALDDFGAGFCSFNYLKRFPVDYVKIDGQFIQNLINDETDQILVKSMTEIANQLGKKTIAEYVESSHVAIKLIQFGVDFGQGFFFGTPKNVLLHSDHISIKDLLDNK